MPFTTMVANDNTTTRYQHSHSVEDAGTLPSEVEEDLFGNGHKVVAYPGSNRGRLSVRDVVSSSKYNQASGIPGPSPKRERPRSLSAGRSPRAGSPRKTDIVQEVYNKLGVKRQSYLVNERGDPCAPGGAVTTSPLRQRTEKIQERYRNALSSRGRDSTTTAAAAATTTSSINRDNNAVVELAMSKSSDEVLLETRSLSRGSRLLTSRWPPASRTTAAATTVVDSFSPKRTSTITTLSPVNATSSGTTTTTTTAPAANNTATGTVSPITTTQAYGFGKNKSITGSANNSNISNNHNHKAATNEKPVLLIGRTMSKEEELLVLQEVPPPPLSTSAATTSEHQPAITPAAEHNGPPPSVKDRMRMYGNKAGGIIGNHKNRSSNIGRRSVDPEYAAQFASRNLPPKVDIYEGRSKDEYEEEKKEDDGLREPASPADLQPPAATTSDEVGIKSNHSRVTNTTAAAISSSASTVSASSRKNSRVASAFLAAVHQQGGKAESSTHLVGGSNSSRSNNNHEYDDNESFTSSLSGEGINAKSRWQQQHQPQQNNSAHERNRLSAYSNATTNSALANNAASSNNNNDYDLQRLIDDRVQGQISELVQKVEERMTLRLQVTEERLLNVEAELARLRKGYK